MARRATSRYLDRLNASAPISQRDLRMRAKEIMDALESGQSFTVTRGGDEIGELVPLRARRQFVPRSEFAERSRSMPALDIVRWRAEQQVAYEEFADDPYAR